MKCPVCQAPDLPDDQKQCAQCGSDLQAFHLTRKIEKSNKNRLGFGLAASLLFLALLVVWVFTGLPGQSANNELLPEDIVESAGLQEEVSQLQATNEELNKKLEQLNQQMATMVPKPPERSKEYVVRNGESLFGIARKVYGNGFRYEDLARDNGIKHPERIRTGQKLTIYY